MKTKIIKRSKVITITMEKKGQMSLEMIIGLLILLVVAVVVIRMFLSSMNPDVVTPNEELERLGFYSKCESLCSKYKSTGTRANLAKFCYTRLEGEPDLNGNGLIDQIPADTKIFDICEDMIYCFHITECKTDAGVIDWSDCRDVVCEAVRRDYDIYNDAELDSTVKNRYFPGVGSCELKNDNNNWWQMYFGGAPCSAPPDVRFIGTCEIGSSGSYSCPNARGLSNCGTGVTSVVIEDSSGGEAVAIQGTGANDVGSINLGDGLSGSTELQDGDLQDCSDLVFMCLDLNTGIIWEEHSTSCTLN